MLVWNQENGSQNSKQVLAAIPKEKQASESVIRDAEQPLTKTLGV